MISPAFETQYDVQPGPASRPFTDETITTEPRRATRWGSAARVTRKGPVRFVRRVASHPSSVSSASGALSPTPALLTTTSTPPNAATAASTAAAAPSGVPTSPAETTAGVGSERATSSSGARLLPARQTPKPSPASVSATARPMPVPAPVTTAARLTGSRARGA